jgi:hypothetical protein
VAAALTIGTTASVLLPDGRIPIVLGARLLDVFAGAFVVAASVVRLSACAPTSARSAQA